MQKNNEQILRREFIGTVVSDKMDKTIVVKVDRHSMHPIFKKRVKIFNKYKAHDQLNTAKTGDIVKIKQSRPLSRDKRWILAGIVKKFEG